MSDPGTRPYRCPRCEATFRHAGPGPPILCPRCGYRPKDDRPEARAAPGAVLEPDDPPDGTDEDDPGPEPDDGPTLEVPGGLTSRERRLVVVGLLVVALTAAAFAWILAPAPGPTDPGGAPLVVRNRCSDPVTIHATVQDTPVVDGVTLAPGDSLARGTGIQGGSAVFLTVQADAPGAACDGTFQGGLDLPADGLEIVVGPGGTVEVHGR